MIRTNNRGFGEWGEIFGDRVVAAALLDQLLHHAIVAPIGGNSYRPHKHAALIPEHLRNRPAFNEVGDERAVVKRQTSRSRKEDAASTPG